MPMRRTGLLIAAGLLILATAFAGTSDAAERRVALVIGNGAYRFVNTLKNPDTDARLMARTLRGLGFTLVGGGAQLDLDRAGMESAIRQFRAAISPGSVAFFYYSGHGVQVDGSNYLVPVSAAPASARDVPVQMVAADLVVQDMADAGAALNVMVLDACRNNPFVMTGPSGGTRGLRPGGAAGTGGSAAPAGLAEMHAPRATLISFATQPGDVAFDGGPGMKDSPYTTALAQSLDVPGLDIVGAFNRAGLEVGRLTGDRQEPWLAISPIEHDVYLAGGPGVQAPAPPLPPAREQPEMATARTPRMARPAPPASAPATAAPVAAAAAPVCPAAGLQATRNGAVPVRYSGAEPSSPEVCVFDVGGVPQARVRGIWPADWPGATEAGAAMRQVLHGPPGSAARFRVSETVPGLRDTLSSETWQFTLTNQGPGTFEVAGTARPVFHVRWDERNLAHPYQAQADIVVDARTGVVLAQAYRLLSGGRAAAYDFWAAFQGGLAAVPDYRVTALR